MKALRKQLRASVAGRELRNERLFYCFDEFLDSYHLRQALEGEYPKLLKLQNDLINRLNQLQAGFSDLDMDPIDEEAAHDVDQVNEKEKYDNDDQHCFLNENCSMGFQSQFPIKSMF